MDQNISLPLNWKTCFKKILAPHLLNPPDSEEQSKETDKPHKILKAANCTVRSLTSQKDSEGKRKDITFLNTKEISKNDEHSNGDLNDLENLTETEENPTSIITAHAEELGRCLKAFKVTKNQKNSNKTKSNRRVPDWNTAIQKVLSPESVSESLKTPNFSDSSYSEISNPALMNPWTFHRLCKEDIQQSEQTREVPTQTYAGASDDMKRYTKEEKKVLELLESSRSFKRKEKPKMNVFDGAGANRFKNYGMKYSVEF